MGTEKKAPSSVPASVAELGTRIAQVADMVGGKRALAEKAGLQESQLYRYIKGENVPGVNVVVDIANAGGVGVGWLAAGKGPMRQDGNGEIREAAAEFSIASKEVLAGDDYVFPPLYDVRAATGGGALVDRESILDVLAFKSRWIRTELRANPSNLFLVYVEGESMEPALRPGDLVLIDRAATIRDGIYVIRIGDGLLVKRLQRLPGNQVKATSDNPAYGPFTIDLGHAPEGVSIVGRVVWSGRRM